MQENSVFDKLVNDLGSEERLNMLEKIKNTRNIDPNPLIEGEVIDEYDQERAYYELSLIERIVLYFRFLFSSQTKEQVIEDIAIQKMAKRIERNYPGLISYKNGEVYNKLYYEINALKEKLAFFKGPFEKISGKNKPDFIAFLGGWLLPVTQARFLSETVPETVAYEKSIENEYDVKREIEFRIEDILTDLTQEDRRLMYQDAKNLHCLKTLVYFPYDSILDLFTHRNQHEPSPCAMSDIRKPLASLFDVLQSFTDPPDEKTLKALFLFSLQGELEEKQFNIESKMTELMDRVEAAMIQVRHFNSRLPLWNMIKIFYRNMSYAYNDIGGGEDWFALYKHFWYQRAEEKNNLYIEEKKRERIIQDAARFVKRSKIPHVDYYYNGYIDEKIRVRYEMTLSFMKIFLEQMFLSELHPPLKLVLIDGQFYKEQNREDFNESYNGLFRVNDEIKILNRELGPEGQGGKEIEQRQQEMVAHKFIIKKIMSIIKIYDKEAERIITNYFEHIKMLINVIGGITQGEMGGRFDTLSNLAYLGKSGTKTLLARLEEVQEKLEEAKKITTDLYEAEWGMKY